MNDCQRKGCKYFQTHCVTCGRLVNEKIFPPKPTWIDVKEKRPSCLVTVILNCDQGVIAGWIESEPQEDPSYYSWEIHGWAENVTHWMPLPERPQ
jgi:hypothetical protein